MPPKRKVAEIETPDSDPATVKRRRVSRACDQCRAARERCDGVRPQCLPCVTQSRPCTYEVSPKKRGVATGYIRTLELALAWVFDHVSGTEDALNTALAQDGSRIRALITGKDASGADRLHQKWRNSRAHRGIDYILSGNTAEPYPSRYERSPSPDASFSEGEPPTLSPNPSREDTVPNHRPAVTAQPENRQLGKSLEQTQDDKPASSSLKPLKLPPNHWRLLDIYLSYTHSWLPILEKQALFQTSYLYSEDGLNINPSDPSSAAHAELWSALALASLQDAACSSSASTETSQADASPTDIYCTARGLIPSEHGPYRINHARALVLLGLVGLSRGDSAGVSLLIGSAIRIALSVTQPNNDKAIHRIQAVLMACFMVETVLSVRYGTLPHLRVEDISDVAAIPEDGMDQWDPWTPCDGFGISTPDSRQSRNPAFCISTFNQLYAIFKVVASDISAKRRGTILKERTMAFLGNLQQALNPSPPFGNLINSGANSPVPTFYIIRATYLWASALADPYSESPIPLLRDTLDQYQKRFGNCSMPPMLSACVATLALEEHLAIRAPAHREQLKELVSTHLPRLVQERHNPTTSTSDLGLPTPPAKLTRPTHSVMPIPNVAAVSFYNNPIMAQHSQHSDSSYGGFTNQRLIPTYDQRRFSGSSTSLPPADSIDMHIGASVTYRMPNLDLSQRHTLTQGFGGNTDYDALLDDLASIECTDQIDVDPQFMTNLGFAPGCDIAEIFTRDFGGV